MKLPPTTASSTRRGFLAASLASIVTGSVAYAVGRETSPTRTVPTPNDEGVLRAKSFGVVADGNHDDTDAMQRAIQAAETHAATLQLPLGTIRTTAPLEIRQPMTLSGAGAYVLWGSQQDGFDSIDIPLTPPFLSGTVLLVDEKGVDGLRLTGPGLHANLRDFGIRFAHSYASTGDGIVAEPPSIPSGGRDNGLQGVTWERIAIHGHDGDHYAYRFVNPIYGTFRDLRGFGGGLLHVENDASGSGGHYGNCVFDHLYGQLHVAGTADGIHLADPAGLLNLLCFVRPQVSTTDKSTSVGTPPPGRTQHIFYSDPTVLSVSLLAPDFESNVGGTCRFGTGPGWFIDVGGRISSPTVWDAMTGSATIEHPTRRLRSDMTFVGP